MMATPEEFVRTTVEREGVPGAAWLAGLPKLVRDMLAHRKCVPRTSPTASSTDLDARNILCASGVAHAGRVDLSRVRRTAAPSG